MRLTLLPADDARAGEGWKEVERRVARVSLACRWDWTGTWLRHFGDLVDARVALAHDEDGRACAAALVVRPRPRRRGPMQVRELCLGTSGTEPPDDVYVEYNGVLATADAATPFPRLLLDALVRERGWDVLRADGMELSAAEPLLSAGRRFRRRVEPSPYADLRTLAGNSGEILSGLSRGARQQIRRSIRGFGAIEGEWAADRERAQAIFAELVDLHQRRWRAEGEPGAFASERVVGFHRDLIHRLGPDGTVLFRVTAGGETVGCLYLLVDGDRLLFYQGGLARFEDAKLKPGLVAHALCMQAAHERGLREYDFLAGDSDYKRRLSTGARELVWATSARPRARLALLDGGARVRRWLRRTARRRP